MSTTHDATMSVDTVVPSQMVVERVAACEGVDHTDLVPLFDAIDPDALDDLVEQNGGESVLEVTFNYHGYDVTVTGDGLVHLDTDTSIDG